MPDDSYRRLSDEERVEILEGRIAKGYPLHSPPHPFRQTGAYAITVATYQHAHLINSNHRRSDFQSKLLGAFAEVKADISGWVILSNHYHLLVGVDSLDIISTTLKQLHGRTSRDWNLEDELTGKRKIWYKFFDRQIRNERHFLKALNYIHYNPVKHNFVDSPYDWPWSSVHFYYESEDANGCRNCGAIILSMTK